jgi:hypothetical protein
MSGLCIIHREMDNTSIHVDIVGDCGYKLWDSVVHQLAGEGEHSTGLKSCTKGERIYLWCGIVLF